MQAFCFRSAGCHKRILELSRNGTRIFGIRTSSTASEEQTIAPSVNEEKALDPELIRLFLEDNSDPKFGSFRSKFGAPDQFSQSPLHGNVAERQLSEDPLNEHISRLVQEAIREMDRISTNGGLQRDSVKRTIWTVLGLFRDILREHSYKQNESYGTELPEEPRRLSSNEVYRSIRLNASIMSIASAAKKDLESLGKNPSSSSMRPILTGMIESLEHMLETQGDAMNDVNYLTMLHRVASISLDASKTKWLLQEHSNFIKNLLEKTAASLDQFRDHSYAFLIASLGKLGPLMRTLIINNHSYDIFFQDILERSRKSFSSFDARDINNVLYGLSNSGVSLIILRPFLRAFSRVVIPKAGEFSPESLRCLMYYYSKMHFTQDPALYTHLSEAAERRIQDFSPSQLASFLKGLVILQHNGTPTFIDKTTEIAKEKMNDFSLADIVKTVHSIALLSRYPEEHLLNEMLERFEKVSDTSELNTNVVYSMVATLSHLDMQRDDSLTLCKRHFIENAKTYNFSVLPRFLTELCTMNHLDDPVLKAVEDSGFAKLSVQHYNIDQKRHLCKILIFRRVVQKKDTPTFVSRDLEEACYTAWRTTFRNAISFGIVYEVFNILGTAGFECKGSWVIETIPISVSSAVLSAADSGLGEDLKLVIDPISKTQMMFNNDNVLPPHTRWRQSVLEALDWKVLHVKSKEWNKLVSDSDKAQYLAKKILEKTGRRISQLEEYKKERKHELSVVEVPLSKPEKSEPEQKESSELQEAVRSEGEKIQLTPDLLVSEQNEEDGLFQNVVSIVSPDENPPDNEPPPEDFDKDSFDDSLGSDDSTTSTDNDDSTGDLSSSSESADDTATDAVSLDTTIEETRASEASTADPELENDIQFDEILSDEDARGRDSKRFV